MKEQTLSFKVSSGLKNIIGRELITDRYIAVFELVKNSYDAGATEVNISYKEDVNGMPFLIVEDNGMGMDYDDIINKWLFVAYSEKKDEEKKKSYRDEMKREYAGAKGIGRFSCDCLGASLRLITKKKGEEIYHILDVDWNSFDVDEEQEFIDVPVKYLEQVGEKEKQGARIEIYNLREPWTRNELLRLKRALIKLISPDTESKEKPFNIFLSVPSEQITDDELLKKYKDSENNSKSFNVDRDIVNGRIRNDILERMNLVTTNIEVSIPADGKYIETKLVDRGVEVFSVKEKNRKYGLLKDINVSVLYLNRSAKLNFARQMGGVSTRAYGSIFVYKNGFRINPYGDAGQDFFGIDSRKQQGYARFLGTRDIMGKILIKGENRGFIETSSRAHGFVNTESVVLLQSFFVDKVLRVLEKYVTQMINWGEPLKTGSDEVVRPEDVGAEILSQFLGLVPVEDVIEVLYNPDIFLKESSNTDNITTQLKILEDVAVKTQNEELAEATRSLKRKTEQIFQQNAELEKENEAKQKELGKIAHENEIKTRQIYFLQAEAQQDVRNLMNGYHTVYTQTDAAKNQIAKIREMITTDSIDKEKLYEKVALLSKIILKLNKLSELALSGNSALKQSGENDIEEYIRQYISKDITEKGISFLLDCKAQNPLCRFDVTCIGLIIDNLASNSKKHNATKLFIEITDEEKYVQIAFADNGIGLDPSIDDPDMLFEWGVSSNSKKRGYGIGLCHVKAMVNEMKGDITIDKSYKEGFKIVITLKR